MSRFPVRALTIFAQWNRTKPCCVCYPWLNTLNTNNFIQSRNSSTGVDVTKLEHIYHGQLSKKIRWLKILSWNSTGIFYMSLPFFYLYFDLSSAQITAFTVLGTITSATPLMGHILFKKYATDLYYDRKKDVYTAAFYGLFGFEKHMQFTLSDVKHLGIEVFSTVKIKNRPLFFDPRGFSEIEHYKRMLGYDKPIVIPQKKNEIESVYKELQEMRKERQKITSSKESKVPEPDPLEENTRKIQQQKG